MKKIITLKLEHISGFENVEFTESSGRTLGDGDLTIDDAFHFASGKGSELQTLRQAVAARMDAEGNIDIHGNETGKKSGGFDPEYGAQWTRTGAIYVPEGKKVYVAFDDEFLEEFQHRQYEAHSAGKRLFLDSTDELIAQALERARDTKRFVEVAKQGSLRLSTCQYCSDHSQSEFEKNNIIRAAFQDMTYKYAHFLAQEQSRGYTGLLKPEQVKDKVEVRPVLLNAMIHGGSFSAIRYGDSKYNGGQARGTKESRDEQK